MTFALLYIILTALSALLRQIGAYQVSPALILFVGSIISIIFFNAVNITKLKEIYQNAWDYKKNWFYMSLAITYTWTCAVYSPGYIGASLYTFLYFSTGGVTGAIMFKLKNENSKPLEWISIMGTIFLLLFIAIKYIIINATFKEILGIGLAFTGGLSGYIYSAQSANFMKKATLSPSQTLAVRFFMLIPVSVLLFPPHTITNLTPGNISLIFLVASFTFIIPLYCFQRSLYHMGPELNSIVISITPFFTALLEQFYFHNVSWDHFIIYIAYILLVSLPYLVNKKLLLLRRGPIH